MKAVLAWATALCVLVLSSRASAVSGTVSGTFQLRGIQAHYCDTTQGMDCTAARFPAALATGLQPVRDADVVIRDEAGVQIGSGVTNQAGQYSIGWSRATTPTSITLRLYWRHKDGRFKLVTDTDSQYVTDMYTTTPVANGNKAIPTRFAGADQLTNFYDGAQRTWFEALTYSGLMTNLFTNVKIRYQNVSRGALANGSVMTIWVGADQAQLPSPIISHEMGHIASYISKPFTNCAASNYPTACSGAGTPASCAGTWHIEEPEWHCLGFEEALATFIGDVSYYWYYATDPRTCQGLSATVCDEQLEPSPGNNCIADLRRRPINADRYLWDSYDTGTDGGWDTVNMAYWQLFTGLQAFLTSTGDGGNEEPWKADMSQIDAPDGRRGSDMYKYLVSQNATINQWSNNCGP